MNKLIMPKQTSKLERVLDTLDILMTAKSNGDDFISNEYYKQKIIEKVDDFDVDSDPPMLVKQSEIARYFGLALGNFQKRTLAITTRGIEFYNNFDTNRNKCFDLIAESIINDPFGRDNTVSKTSDSDLDPPKLFVKSILTLNGVSKSELAILIYLTNDLNLNYESAIYEVMQTRRNLKTIELPDTIVNKYNDAKFPSFLAKLGFCILDDKQYILCDYVQQNFSDKFSNLSIYNSPPSSTTTILDDQILVDFDDADIDNLYTRTVQKTLPYDLSSQEFVKQNSRTPEKNDSSHKSTRYKTNSRIAKTAIANSNYTCQFDHSHTTFTNKSNVQFMEPHHLIPMAAQKNIPQNLDCIENIISLCPNCHSAIHYGNDETRKEILSKLWQQVETKISSLNIYISFEDLFTKYYK